MRMLRNFRTVTREFELPERLPARWGEYRTGRPSVKRTTRAVISSTGEKIINPAMLNMRSNVRFAKR
jgi:hypothetical protein